MNDKALNAEDVASLLHIGRNAVYALAKSGDLPSYRMGRKLLFSLEDVEHYRLCQRSGSTRSGATEPKKVGTTQAAQLPGIISSSLAALPARQLGAPPLDPQSSRGFGEPFLLAGQGLSLDLLVNRLDQEGGRTERVVLESYAALVALYEGSVDGALIHLYDQRTNSYNVPYVQRLAPGLPIVVMRTISRYQGFAVAVGNPRGISSWGALLRPGVRLANRPIGCGARVLLDEKLLALEAHLPSLEGYEHSFPTGLAAAQAVASGRADVAVVDESLVAQVDGVEFVPLQREWLDVAVSKSDRSRAWLRALRTVLTDKAFAREYARVTHGNAVQFGSIVYEC